ncbi:MAG: HYExAFE family protein [Phycisphaerales bacterium JB059]
MAQRRHHYERAFESYLRQRRIPYVAVNEARKALLPPDARLRLHGAGEAGSDLKSFDFVVYGDNTNLLIEIKGRKIPARGNSSPRLENWVTRDDVASLGAWQRLFGPGYEGHFVFVYQCERQPPDALFQEVIEREGRWYALRAVALDEYAAGMKTRSPRWGTVDLPRAVFDRISRPFSADTPRPGGPGAPVAGVEAPALAPIGGEVG